MHEPTWQAWLTRLANFPRQIGFDYPSRTLPISITGAACALDCAHCGRHYLRHMVPLADASAHSGLGRATSLLISGGCDTRGRVPITSALATVPQLRPGRRLNWHVGLVEEDDIDAIRPYVDVVSFDFVGDDETIREVYGLDRTVDDYVMCYRRLRAAVPVVPHITIGLRGGQIHGERTALSLLERLGATAVVFLVFIPTSGTLYAARRPPDIHEVVELLAEARVMFPSTPLTLGCMRPGGAYRASLDPLAVRAGINRLVNPARAAVATARATGLEIVTSDECCAF